MRWLILLLLLSCQVSVWAQSAAGSLADIKAAAEAGDPAAQTKFAEQLILRMDSNQADSWLRKAAEQGYAPAQGKLGYRLLTRSRISINGTKEERATIGDEALKWATIAAFQGNKRGQADLADIYLEGKLVTQDLIQAYKWGDLASRGSLIDTAAIKGRSTRDAAILKMSTEQIAEARKLVAAFTPHKPSNGELPEPSWIHQIRLSGLSGPANRRLAVINSRTLSEGETVVVKLDARSVKLHCLKIREESVLVKIEGIAESRELTLTPDTP